MRSCSHRRRVHARGARPCETPTDLDLITTCISLGSKRNWLASQARGAVLANFDDDDVYAPSYLTRMCTALLTHEAQLVKLGSFLHLDAPSHDRGSLSLCDPDRIRPGLLTFDGTVTDGHTVPSGPVHGFRWGYGFSCVYTAELAAACPYGIANFGEGMQRR